MKEITGNAVVLLVLPPRLLFIDCGEPQITHHRKQAQIAANKLPLRVNHTLGRRLVPIQFYPHTAAALPSQHEGNNRISSPILIQIKRE